jgi:hypothetical protein
VQAFDVDDQARLGDVQGLPERVPRVRAHHGERAWHRGIHDRQLGTPEAEFLRACHQAVAVERDRGSAAIGAREEIEWPEFLVMPDFRAVERQNRRHSMAGRPVRGGFDQQAVAVQMQQVRLVRQLIEDAADGRKPSQRIDPQRARKSRLGAPAGHPVHLAGRG